VKRLMALLRLMRPANIITAFSDILAGMAISGYFTNLYGHTTNIAAFILLLLSTACLYGGGVVMNDVFDTELDKVERPERPIPSGLIPKSFAAAFGLALLLAGVLFAGFAQPHNFFSISFFLAAGIAIAALVYDKYGKHHSVVGPLNMGICRGLNLLLGMTIITDTPRMFWELGLIPVIYIAAITMISRGEVHGSHKRIISFAGVLYFAVLVAIAAVAYNNQQLIKTLPFIAIFGVMIYMPLIQAMQVPEGPRIGKAVKMAVLGLILMNAGWAAAFGAIPFALLIVLLLPLSMLVAKVFAVT
jgi:4-hydroxybenzoate polyprenyltransferase